jgi:hypothetical protein
LIYTEKELGGVSERVIRPIDETKELNILGQIAIEAQDDNSKDSPLYGYKIVNKTYQPLFVSLFYFSPIILKISEIFYFFNQFFVLKGIHKVLYNPPIVAADQENAAEPALPEMSDYTVGYGDSGASPCQCTLKSHLDVDVGFLKLFYSTEFIDYSDLVQRTPFISGGLGDDRPFIPVYLPFWGSMLCTIL